MIKAPLTPAHISIVAQQLFRLSSTQRDAEARTSDTCLGGERNADPSETFRSLSSNGKDAVSDLPRFSGKDCSELSLILNVLSFRSHGFEVRAFGVTSSEPCALCLQEHDSVACVYCSVLFVHRSVRQEKLEIQLCVPCGHTFCRPCVEELCAGAPRMNVYICDKPCAQVRTARPTPRSVCASAPCKP